MNPNLNKPVSLRLIIEELLSCYKKAHPQKASFIVNSVSKNAFIYRHEDWLAPLMGELYALISGITEEEMIFIDAKIRGDETKLFVLKRQKIKPPALTCPQESLLPTFSIFPTKSFFGSLN